LSTWNFPVGDLLFDQLDRVRGADDGCVVPVRELRDARDVVEVTVGGDDRLDVALQLAHDAVVRDRAHVDQVEAVHALGLHVVVDEDLTEVQAHVEDDDVPPARTAVICRPTSS